MKWLLLIPVGFLALAWLALRIYTNLMPRPPMFEGDGDDE